MRYFKNNYKKMIMPTVFLTIIGIAIYVIPISLVSSYYPIHLGDTNVFAFSLFLMGISIFIPIYEFGFVKSKRGGDLYYSLPITRGKLNLQFYLKGLIEIVVTYLIVFFLGLLVVKIKDFDLNFIYYLPMFLMFLMGLVALYSINCFIFSKANNIIDGIIFILAYLVISFVVIGALDVVIYKIIGMNSFRRLDKIMFSPIMMLSYFSFSFQYLLFRRVDYTADSIFNATSGTFFIIWFIVGIVAALSLVLFTKYNKPENIQQKSNSWFGYKTIIPIFLTCLIVVSRIDFKYASDITVLILWILAAYVAYVVYERTFKIKWYNLVIIVDSVLIGLFINLLVY